MKNINISVVSNNECTGCGACYNACNKQSIIMKHDKNGFLRPIISKDKCIMCGQCADVCPIINPIFENDREPKCYAAIAEDDNIRMMSSSGGIFPLLATKILSENGVICGVAFDNEFLAEHIIIDNIKDLYKLQGSKYMQSNTKSVYREIKSILDSERKVLFSGCPCQVAGLNSFLKKKYEGLVTIDLMCHGGPSPLLFKKYLHETYANKLIKNYSFRDKSVFGWSTEANVYFEDGTSVHIKRDQDNYYRAFLPCLSVRKSCGSCKFATLPRQGDITLADFWGVHKYNKNYTDGKGTSIVIINSKDGMKLYKKISGNLKLNKEVPLEYIKKTGQPLEKSFKLHPEHDRFFQILRKNSLNKAFHYIKNRKFDVGVIGVWPGLNYGSVLTYFALQYKLKEFGLSPLMIDKPGASLEDPERKDSHSRKFAKDHFYISKSYALKDLHVLNKHCDSFLVGSDQVWNYGISKNFGKSFYLNFVNDDKKKIAYAASFGHSIDFAPEAERWTISNLMKQFDAISVREKSGVDLCKNIYGVKATHVLDPVFLINQNIYMNLAERSKRSIKDPYILAYILDVTPEKKELILHVSKKLGLKLVVLLDGFAEHFKVNKAILGMDDCVQLNVDVYDWLYCFCNASYIVTDSFHGTSFSILLNKQFLSIPNKRRGYTRFESILNTFELKDRLINNPAEEIIKDTYSRMVDYNKINKIIDSERMRCMDWIKNAWLSPKIRTGLSSYPVREMKIYD